MQNQETTNKQELQLSPSPQERVGVRSNSLRTAALALMAALTPTASTITTTVGAGALAASTMSCETDKPIDPVATDGIDRKTDNPAHKAEFMKDVKSAVLGGGIATMEYDAVWVKDHYELQPKSMVDFARAAAKLEEYAKANNRNKEDLMFTLFYENNAGVKIWWRIPYNELTSIGGNQNLNDNAFDKYIGKSDLSPNGGNPDATVSKDQSGFLRINVSENSSTRVISEIQVISPYIFGK
jgi:hypothetical protein